MNESEELIERAVTELLSTSHGKEFLWWIMSRQPMGAMSTSMETNQFLAGERNVIVQVIDQLLTYDPAALAKLHTYALTRKNLEIEND